MAVPAQTATIGGVERHGVPMSASFVNYLPMDRRHALAAGRQLPEHAQGAALFADISGSAPLTEAFVFDLGPQRGAEMMAYSFDLVLDALISSLHAYGGSVIGFSGDAITCWLDGDDGSRATACALQMQRAMADLAAITTPSGRTVRLAMKAAVAVGAARRFLLGDPRIQVFEALVGTTLDRLAEAEHLALAGEVVLDPVAAAALGERVRISDRRCSEGSNQWFAVVGGLEESPAPHPWPALDADALPAHVVRAWLAPAVQERLLAGEGEFLVELRPAVALFLRFTGIDIDNDPMAGGKLDFYIRRVQSILTTYDGTLVQLTFGDKGSFLYAAFGAPRAHEDDSDRAVAAALDLRTVTEECGFIASAQLGLARGRMRTGAYGARSSRTYGVLGDTVNLAARLMQAAETGQILVSQDVRRGTSDGFLWRELPPLRVKGKSKPVSTSELIGRAGTAPLGQAPRFDMPIVDRRDGIDLALARFAEARRGRGQIVAVTGEAGVGKSRVVAEVIAAATHAGIAVHSGECQTYGSNAGYFVWRSIWRSLLGIGAEGSAVEVALAAHLALMSLDADLLPRLPLLGPVLGVPIPDNDLTESFDAKLRKTSLEGLLAACLRGLAERGPLLLVLEDCNRLDDLSHDLLDVLGRAISDQPVLIAMTYRPLQLERLREQRVSTLPHFTEIALDHLLHEDAVDLIRRRVQRESDGHVEVSDALIARVIGRAQGNPFYIEELLNDLRDQGIAPEDDAAVAHLPLPSSLHSLLLTRIDRLPEQQRITLKVASVVGRVFDVPALLAALPSLGTALQIDADLDELRRLDLVLLERAEPEPVHQFKSVVTQEVAYESLPFAIRETLHGRLAEFLEMDARRQPAAVDLLAFHYGRSANLEKKREYLLKAAEAARKTYANIDAIDYYREALPLLDAGQQADVLLVLGKVYELTGAWDDAERCYRDAGETASSLGRAGVAARTELAMGELLRKRGEFDAAAEQLVQARLALEAAGDEAGVGEALHYTGNLSAQRGDLATARAAYSASLDIRRRLNDQQQIASLLSNLGIVARYEGDLVAARSLHEQGLAIRRNLGDRWALAVSLSNLGNVAHDEGAIVEARSLLEEAVQLQRDVGSPFALAQALDNLGNVVRAQGDVEAARAYYRESLLINRELGDRWAIAYLFEDIALLRVLERAFEHALTLAGVAEAVRATIGVPRSSAEEDKFERGLAPAREHVTAAAQVALLARGRAQSLDSVLDAVLAELAGSSRLQTQ